MQAKGGSQIQNIDNEAKRNLLAALSSVQDTGVYGLEVHILLCPLASIQALFTSLSLWNYQPVE